MHSCEEKKDGCRDFLTLPRISYEMIYVVWSSKISLKSVIFTFQFSTYLFAPFLQLHFAENPIKIGRFHRYEQLKDAKNNRKQKTFSSLFGSILKSIFPTSDWFCLITSHISYLLRGVLTMNFWNLSTAVTSKFLPWHIIKYTFLERKWATESIFGIKYHQKW